MATASVTYNFTNGTAADAEQVDTNFNDLVSFINTNCVQKDGSLAFTGAVSLPAADPSSDNHAVRRAYVQPIQVIKLTSDFDLGSIAQDFYTPPAFTMPTVTSPHVLVVDFFAPRVINWFGSGPDQYWVELRKTDNTVLQHVESLGQDDGGFYGPNFFLRYIFTDNSQIGAGASAALKLRGQTDGSGQRFDGSTTSPIYYTVYWL